MSDSHDLPGVVAQFLHLLAQRRLRSMTEKREQISELIVSYLGKHPDAQDTLDGVADWWLTFERIELSTSAVADALMDLVRQGVVTLQKSGDGTTFYKLNSGTGSAGV